MQNTESDVIDSFATKAAQLRRRDLLPWWIKTFTWIFIITGGIAVLSFVAALFGVSFQMAFYGLETSDPQSLTGIFLIAVFLLKGFTAFGLWTEKDWAVIVGLIDASIGIAICFAVMFFIVDREGGFSFRAELLLLIPFLLKQVSIREAWKNRR